MLIIDGHLDLSMNAIQWDRDLLQSVYTIRAQENMNPQKGRGQGTVAFPEMRQGRIALSFATLIARSTGLPVPGFDFRTPMQAYGMAHGQLAYYRALEQGGYVRIIDDARNLDAHINEWQIWEEDADPDSTPPLGFVISMEGADPIEDPQQLQEWWDAGLRLLGPTHYGPGRYAGGTGTELGLTELGPPLLAEMERLGIALDLTHCSDQSFWQALDLYGGPVLASHNNCRALVPHQRQFSDEQLVAIIERDGVIGVPLTPGCCRRAGSSAIQPTKTSRFPTSSTTSITSANWPAAARHVAIGTDLDGGYGREQSPCDLDTIADLQGLTGLLAERGYSPDDVASILHGNWISFLHRVWCSA
jgi:membrane dipeptidase